MNVLAAGAKPLPTIARLRDMNMYDLYCGKHLELEPEPSMADKGVPQS